MKSCGRRGRWRWLAAAWLLPFCGCVSFNVGRPEVFKHSEIRSETADTPKSTEVVSVRGVLDQTGNTAGIGLEATAREEFEKTQFEERTVVTKQKRLAIGLFPGAAEIAQMPPGALACAFAVRIGSRGWPESHVVYQDEAPFSTMPATLGNYAAVQLLTGIFGVGVLQALGTVDSLLIQPFGGYSCGYHDFIDRDCFSTGDKCQDGTACFDASVSPQLRALRKFSREERGRIGIRTCFDGTAGDHTFIVSHMGLAGIHKYLAVSVEPSARGPTWAAGVETKTRRSDVPGPYVAELSIPALGYTRVQRVEKGATRVEFELPPAERRCTADAVVSFRADVAGRGAATTRQALEKAAGQTYRFEVALRMRGETAPTAAEPARTPAASAPQAPPTAAGKSARPPYEVVGIAPQGNGRYEVRVRIADKSKTFDIGWAVEADVKRMIREDFANRHPDTGIQFVREMVEWETEEDGAILLYRGWAFSARPMSDGWSYDDESRRGTVRLRISDGMPPEEAKRWARRNIEAIVKEKNVALEAGRAPPEGAMYRSLGELMENGVLTVEFEAVE